ncbi:hypothetical protein YN1_7840 [Nanoarchaeota archaeon]
MVVQIGEYWGCEECHNVYESKELAEKCEEWCKEHKSCNLEIVKQSIGTYEEECGCDGENCTCNDDF